MDSTKELQTIGKLPNKAWTFFPDPEVKCVYHRGHKRYTLDQPGIPVIGK